MFRKLACGVCRAQIGTIQTGEGLQERLLFHMSFHVFHSSLPLPLPGGSCSSCRHRRGVERVVFLDEQELNYCLPTASRSPSGDEGFHSIEKSAVPGTGRDICRL